MTDEGIEKALKDRAYQISYADGDMSKGLFIIPKDKLSQETLAYIERLKEACQSAIQSFTRMETLYKVKCNELEFVAEKTKKCVAKEILQHFMSLPTCQHPTIATGHFTFGKDYIRNLAKEYGVEVDDE